MIHRGEGTVARRTEYNTSLVGEAYPLPIAVAHVDRKYPQPQSAGLWLVHSPISFHILRSILSPGSHIKICRSSSQFGREGDGCPWVEWRSHPCVGSRF